MVLQPIGCGRVGHRHNTLHSSGPGNPTVPAAALYYAGKLQLSIELHVKQVRASAPARMWARSIACEPFQRLVEPVSYLIVAGVVLQ